MTIPEIAQIISTGVDISLLGVAISLTRYFSRLEFKVNQMWAVFSRRYGSRIEGRETSSDDGL